MTVADRMAEDLPPPIRLMNFVSQEQLEEAKRSRGERVEDGTAQRDRPLYEILKENKDKRDAEFNERFKHRPPKALDEDETEFLDKLEMTRKEYEQQMADKEAQELQRFQAAVAAQSMHIHEVKETPRVSDVQWTRTVGKKNQAAQPLGMIIKVKPPAKKAKADSSPEWPLGAVETPSAEFQQCSSPMRRPSDDIEKLEPLEKSNNDGEDVHDVAKTGLVSYSDESDDD